MDATKKPEERPRQTFQEDLRWNVTNVNGNDVEIRLLIALSDGNVATYSADDGGLRHWDINTGKCLRCIEEFILNGIDGIIEVPPVSKYYQTASDVFLSTRNNSSAGTNTASARKSPQQNAAIKIITIERRCAKMNVWNLSTGCRELILLGNIDAVFDRLTAFMYLQNDTIATVWESAQHHVRIWEIVDTSTALKSTAGTGSLHTTVSLSGTGEQPSREHHRGISAALEQRRVKIRCLRGHRGRIVSLAELANGNLVSGAQDSTIRIWDLTIDPHLYCCVRVLYCVTKIAHLRVLGDGVTIVSDGGRGNRLLFWDTNTGTAFRPISGKVESVSGIEVLSDGVTVVTSNYHGKLMLWNFQHMVMRH
jgi:WD40 repeat protein